MRIDVATAVDVGANFGEIALWFACQFPHATVLAVEPSSLNVQVLYANIAAQRFPTASLRVVQCAVSDRNGVVHITRGVGPMVRIVAEDAAGTETVACERLDTLLDRCGVNCADFVKIDIEGSEPLLIEAIAPLRGRVRAYYIEFSQFAARAGYLALAQALLDSGYVCLDEAASEQLADTAAIVRYLDEAFAPGPLAVTNLWFVERSHAACAPAAIR
jgi:FkbM family methyltransferase